METGLFQKTALPESSHDRFYQYLLVVNPDKNVAEKVMTEKQAFFKEFKEKIAVKTQPHITVANFLARENMEDTLIRYIQRICSGQPAFDVVLNNYSGFPPHTIYVRVQDPQPFRQLAKELKAVSNYVHSCSCPPVKLITNPHVSIARSLSEDVYFKALIRYSQKTFHDSFLAEELVLLRRSHQYDTCKCVNVFHLKPKEKILFN